MKNKKRNCPKCNNEIIYKSDSGYYHAKKNNSQCRNCVHESQKGKKYTEEELFRHRERMKKVDRSYLKTEDRRKKISNMNSGKNNPMFGKTVYEVWIKKYGKEEADKKMLLKISKQKQNNSGSGNPMYGKASPNGSGNGWKGWYKNFFFRSLRELTYMLQLEENGIIWKSAESIRIPYICPLGKNKTYSPDFLVDNKLIEIKPIRLQKSPLVLAKKYAAEKYCSTNNLIYKIVDVKIDSDLINKYIGDIKFMGNYEEKYKKWKSSPAKTRT